MAELIYPTLDLFLYDLRNGLGETLDEIEQNRDQFQAKLPEAVRPRLAQHDQHFEAEYQELLLPERYLPFQFEREALPVNGYYYPVRLNDTYGLLLDASIGDLQTPQDVASFATLRQVLETVLTGQGGNIGQTWLLSGWTTPDACEDEVAIAQACYQQMVPEGRWQQDFQGQGKLLGATIFELWRYRSVLPETHQTVGQSLAQNQHVLICIFPDQDTAKRAAELFYDDWLMLLGFRNKILWAYNQSRQIKQLIKADFATVQASRSHSQTFTAFRETLMQIQDALNHYKLNLIQLDFQGRTIDINLSNYQKRLQRIVDQGGDQTNLDFLQEFVTLVEKKYLLQIHKDSENMQLGLRLLEDAITATQSRLEVEKAERDRDFQALLKYLGVGWAAATVAAEKLDITKLESDPIEGTLENQFKIDSEWANLLSPVVYSLLVAIAVAALFGVSIQLWRGTRALWSWVKGARS